MRQNKEIDCQWSLVLTQPSIGAELVSWEDAQFKFLYVLVLSGCFHDHIAGFSGQSVD